MNKFEKYANLRNGEEELEMLVAQDYSVQQFSPIHFRINNQLDVWPTTQRYYHLITKKKGIYTSITELARSMVPTMDDQLLEGFERNIAQD